jgi:2-phosphosulfolactate phosphatase
MTSALQIHSANLASCAGARGVVAAIDVIRAYTAAAFGLAAGAERILLTATVEEALALRERIPGARVMGEVGGLPPQGFDFGNSPSELAGRNLAGHTLIHRTSAGTQGAVRAQQAAHLFGASFVVAGATARAITALRPDEVTLVATGQRPDDSGDEDLALADYLRLLLLGSPADPGAFLTRVRRSEAAQKFLDPAKPDFPAADLDFCMQLDRFAFAMPITREDGLLVLRKQVFA